LSQKLTEQALEFIRKELGAYLTPNKADGNISLLQDAH